MGTQPLMHVDVILRVARKMFPVYDALLIGMNSASPLLQGRAEPKNDLPVLFCDLRKVYIYIHSCSYISILLHNRGITHRDAPPMSPTMDGMSFLLASVHRDIC